MDGFTGFNPEQAAKSLSNVGAQMYDILSSYYGYNRYFFHELSSKWASPRAVEFGQKFQPMVANSAKDILKFYRSVMIKATDAYDALAKSNSIVGTTARPAILDTSYVAEQMSELDSLSNNNFKDNYYGTVGMNILDAEKVLENYTRNMRDIIGSLNDIPLDIAFYDPGNEMALAYKNALNELKDKISSITQDIDKEVRIAMTEEINTILIAKKEATHTMNNA